MATCLLHRATHCFCFSLLLASVDFQKGTGLCEAVRVHKIYTTSNSTSNSAGILEEMEDALEVPAPVEGGNITEMRFEFEGQGGKAPGIMMLPWFADSAWIVARNGGEMQEQMRKKTGMDALAQVEKIGNQDVHHAGRVDILHMWAKLVEGHHGYKVVLKLQGNPWREMPKPLLMKLFWCILVAGLVPAFFVALCACLLPCFLCRQCGLPGLRGILTVPDGPEEQDQNVPRLDRSLLIRATGSRWLQATLVVLSAAVVAAAAYETLCGSRRYIYHGNPLVSAAIIAFAFSWLLQSIVVIWGCQATKRVTLVAKHVADIPCPVDHESLAGGLRGLACAFAPKLLATILFSVGLLCAVPPRMQFALAELSRPSYPIWNRIADVAHECSLPVVMVACECVLTVMTCRFILDAFIVARTAKSLVIAVKDELRKETADSADPEHLRKIHVASGHLANHVLFELAKISKPTLGLVMLKMLWACSSVVPLVFLMGRAAEQSGNDCTKLLVVGLPVYILSDSLLGLACLWLPASVSDSCRDLVKELNNVRVRPFKKGCEAEVERQIRLTELFLKEQNRGKGLGFVLDGFGTVLDKKMILSMFTKFLALSSIMLTILRKAYEEPRKILQEESLLYGQEA